MPGFGRHIGKAIRTPEGRELEFERKYYTAQKMHTEQVDELVECLFKKYIADPDRESEKLLIMHMGGEFFRKRDAAQQMREPDSLKAGVFSLPDVVKSESNLPA